MKKILLLIGVACTLFLIQACGGGGGGSSSSIAVPSYAGLTTEARVEDTNAESLSTAAASGPIKQWWRIRPVGPSRRDPLPALNRYWWRSPHG